MANLRVAELDFDQIKSNLKTFLQSQDEFVDYDFEGAGLSVLLDILAYNTHYNAYLANMVVNEMFLDSAVKRSSAVSLAKHLGYTPASVRSARANIDVVVNNPTGLPSSLTMDRYTTFSTSINGTSYNFLTNKSVKTNRSGTSYTFGNVEIVEGSLSSFTYTVSDITPSGKYEIPDVNVDTSTLEVIVQTSASTYNTSVYTLCTDITGIDDTSTVYFLEQNSLGKYELYFGDGIIGKQLSVGNIITVRYITSSGSAVNVSSTLSQVFTASSTIGGSSNITVTVNSNSTGAADAESITSIKFNAPKVNAARNRAVTSEDYEALIKATYTGAESVAVWGGEENIPPNYGKIIISLKPYQGFFISDETKDLILNTILSSKKVLALTPEFVDPDYIYAQMTIAVNYNSNLTTLTASGLESLINSKINEYFDTNLNKFNKNFYSSQFIKFLLEVNPAIVSVSPELRVQKRLVPTLNIVNSYTVDDSLKFNNRLHPNEISSTKFYINYQGTQTLVYIQDRADDNPPNYNGTGVISLINAATGVSLSTIGTVNYGTGVIDITALSPTGYQTGQTSIQLTAGLQEVSYNITAVRNQILVLDDSTADSNIRRNAGIEITMTPIVQ